MMTENVRLFRWSLCCGTRNFLRWSFGTNPSSLPSLRVQHEKGALSIADDKKIPTNNDRSFVGAFYMYTNDIASLQIDLTVSRLLMYLFDHIWIIGHPIGPLLNKWMFASRDLYRWRREKKKKKFYWRIENYIK